MATTNWQTKKLGELANYINGYTFKPTDWVSSGLPIIRIQNLNDTNKDYHYFNGDIGEKYRVRKGDILISWSASLGSYIWDKDEAWLNQHIFKVLVNEKEINKDFFYLLSMTVLEEMKRKAHGGTMKHITKNLFENIQVQVPPLSIQQQIVERLDAIRKLQELNNKEIEKAEELFDSYLVQQFTHNKKLVTKKIGEVTESISYGLSTSVAGNLDENGTPILTMAEVNDDGSISYLRIRKIKVGEKERNKFLLSKGDVLFNWRNASKKLIGKTVIFESDRPTIYASFLLKVVPKAELSNYYLAYYLNFLRRSNYFSNYCKEQANNTVNASELRTIDIHYPPLAEQKKIVDELFAIQKYKEQLLLQKEAVTSFFESTLNKAMKGELVQ